MDWFRIQFFMNQMQLVGHWLRNGGGASNSSGGADFTMATGWWRSLVGQMEELEAGSEIQFFQMAPN